MRRSFPRAGSIAAAIVSVAAIAAVATVVLFLLFRKPPLNLTVQGAAVEVPRETTFGQLIVQEGLHAKNGALRDVEGSILQRRLDPGQILLNGDPAPRDRRLLEDDEIVVIDGQDVVEDTERVVTQLNGLQPLNPARSLGSAPMERISIQGETSGKVVRQWTRQTGPTKVPKAIALTFDDGPWPGTTLRILKILKKAKVSATFFVVGYLAERYPGLIHAEQAAGMHIQNHSWQHDTDPSFADLSPGKIENEMVRVNDIIDRTGPRPVVFRPPGGSWDNQVREIAASLGMRIVLWDVDTKDFVSSRKPKQIVKSVLSQVRAGSIILMHDGGGDGAHTAKALPGIIKGIRKMGLGFATL